MTKRGDWESLISIIYQSRAVNNLDGMLKCFHPEGTFRIAGSSLLAPLTTPVRGREALSGLLAGLVRNWDLSRMTSHRVCIEGETAFIHRTGSIVHRPTGRVLETELVDIIVMRDGMAIEFTQFIDTLTVAQASGALPA